MKNKKQLFLLFQAFGLIAILGVVTYALFNYTRTGGLNNLGTGTINFSSNQGNSLNITNLFSMTSSEAASANLDSIDIAIEGDTTYADGEEFVVSFTDVENIVGGKTVPLTYIATYEENTNKTIGSSSNNYYTARNSKNANIYTLSSTGKVMEDEKVLVGYIKSGNTGIDGTLSIKAYIDDDDVAISDTYTHIREGMNIVNTNMTTTELNNCVSFFTNNGYSNYLYEWESFEDFCRGTGTLQGKTFQFGLNVNSFGQSDTESLIAINAVTKAKYTDATTAEWVDGRVVLTTSEWNSIGQEPISFKVRVESNEGIWVEEPSSRNDMVNFSYNRDNNEFVHTYISRQQRATITEINFRKLSESEINKHANLIDLTASGGSGVVKAWIENNILYIASPGEIYFPSYSNFLFQDFAKVKRINFDNINTSLVHHMEGMFYLSSSLEYLDLSGFDTTNLDCCMDYMFYECQNLVTINFSNFNTSRVRDMYYTFYGCRRLEYLDLSSFSTNNVTSMTYMFANCQNLKALDLSNFNTSKVANMQGMFYRCYALESLDVSSFNTTSVTDMLVMFASCKSLKSLDVSSFNTSKVTTMQAMFYECSSLTTLDLSNFNTAKVTAMNIMFCDCSNLTSLNISNFNTSLVTGMGSMFDGCSKLTSLDLSSFNTSSLEGCGAIFYGCSSLVTIEVSNNWDVSGVTYVSNMFNGTTSIVGGQGTVYDENYIDNTYAHVDGGPSNPGYLTLKTN